MKLWKFRLKKDDLTRRIGILGIVITVLGIIFAAVLSLVPSNLAIIKVVLSLVFLIVILVITKILLFEHRKNEGSESIKSFLLYLLAQYADEELKAEAKDKLEKVLLKNVSVYTVSWHWKTQELNMLQLAYLCILRLLGERGCKTYFYKQYKFSKRTKEGIKIYERYVKKIGKPSEIKFLPDKKLRNRLELIDENLIETAQEFLLEFELPKKMRDNIELFMNEFFTMQCMWMEIKNFKEDRFYILVDKAQYQGLYKKISKKYGNFLPVLIWFDVPNRNDWLFLGEPDTNIKEKLENYNISAWLFLYELILLNIPLLDEKFKSSIQKLILFDEKKKIIFLKINSDSYKIATFKKNFVELDKKKLENIYSNNKVALIETTKTLWAELSKYVQK